MWQVCSWGKVAPPARSAWLTGGASTNGVNFGILYIQIYIQICSILYTRAHEARASEAGSDGSMSPLGGNLDWYPYWGVVLPVRCIR